MIKIIRLLSLLGLATTVAAGQPARAADHPIKGDSLLMRQTRSQRKLLFHTVDAALDPQLLADPRRSGATLEVLGGGDGFGASGRLVLAPQFWAALGTPPGSKGYRYYDKGATAGVKQVTVQANRHGGKLTITADGDRWPFSLEQPQHTLSLRLTIGADVYCTLFETHDLARREVGLLTGDHAAAPLSCGPTTCGNGIIEPGEECDSPLPEVSGCCLRGCTLASDDFCHPAFARSADPEKAHLTALYKARIDNVTRQAAFRQGRPKSFAQFRNYVEQLPATWQPDNLFDLAMALFISRPDSVQSFHDDLRRLTPMIAANRSAADLTDKLQNLLREIDYKNPKPPVVDYAQALIDQYEPGLVSVTDVPVVKDPYAVESACSGFPYCEVNPLHFQYLEVPKLPVPEDVSFDQYCSDASTCQWPMKYDLMPRRMYLYWQTSLPTAVVQSMLEEDGYTMSLSINGSYLHFKGPPVGLLNDPPQQQWFGAAFPCDANGTNGCLMTVLITDNLQGLLKPASLPWNIKLEISKLEPLDPVKILGIDQYGNAIIATETAVPFADASLDLVANDTNSTTFFESILYPTFQSDRCTDCHGFGTLEKISEHHGGYAFTNAKLEPSAYSPTGHVITCDNCHDGIGGNPQGSLEASFPGGVFTETAWKAPHQDLDLDWKTKTAAQTCARVKQNLPTRELRHKHFHEDARLYWAIEKPRIFNNYLSKASPEDFALFLSWVDAWNENGAPCP